MVVPRERGGRKDRADSVVIEVFFARIIIKKVKTLLRFVLDKSMWN
jgi:hypothetical protein